MHPIERLRSLARADWLDPQTVAVEAADAIGDAAQWLGEATAVSIARRLLAWHALCGPLWYAAGRILHALEPADEAAAVVEELLSDPTPLMLDAALPEGAEALVIGDGPGLADIAHDSGLWIGDPPAYGSYSRRALGSGIVSPESPHQVRAIVDRASHVLVGALSIGPDGLAARAPARLAAEAATASGRPVWVVAGVGTAVDERLWRRLRALAESGQTRPETNVRSEAWWDDSDSGPALEVNVVDLANVSFVCGPDGLVPPDEAAAAASASPVELLDCAGADAF